MVAIADPRKRQERGFVSVRFVYAAAAVTLSTLVLAITNQLLHGNTGARSISSLDNVDVRSISSLRKSQLQLHQQQNEDQQCRWYLAESAIPQGGLGLFTGTGLLPGEMVGFPDICIFVGDAPLHWTHLRSHTFGGGSFFGQYEGSNSRAACEGFSTTFNTQPDHLVNTELVSPILPTNAGLHRAKSPGAGSITHHFGIHAKAKDVVTAGSELLIDYGDWDFDKNAEYTKPERPVEWLEKHGWCIDHLRVGPSTIPHAGRGAFARHSLKSGQIIAPIPLQAFEDRSIFQITEPEQLYVNYCLQPKDSKMIFYPYGPVFNLVNHADSPTRRPNAYLQWSKSNMHRASWLDLSYEDFWKIASPGGLILELVALRDIQPGEEILIDYGNDWENAWKKHVASWKPPAKADHYVYPAEIDETVPLRTMEEQKTDPYPDNLLTMCNTPEWDRENGNHITWYESKEWAWWATMLYCHILDRTMGENGNYEYTVSLIYSNKQKDMEYDESVPLKDLYIDRKVPRRAIRFLEKPYSDDEHLKTAFRHPIELPDHLVPDAWRNVE